MNRGEIVAQTLSNLRDGGAVRWTSGEIARYIDDGYMEMANGSGGLFATSSLYPLAMQKFVALPSNCLYPIAARDVTTGLPIDLVHWSFIETEDRYFVRRASTRPELAALFGQDRLLLFPMYQADGEIELIYAYSPVSGLANDQAQPLFPKQFHKGLVHYATWRALAKDADGPRIGRVRRQVGHYKKHYDDLVEWADTRTEGLLLSVYGERFRVPQHTWGG